MIASRMVFSNYHEIRNQVFKLKDKEKNALFEDVLADLAQEIIKLKITKNISSLQKLKDDEVKTLLKESPIDLESLDFYFFDNMTIETFRKRILSNDFSDLAALCNHCDRFYLKHKDYNRGMNSNAEFLPPIFLFEKVAERNGYNLGQTWMYRYIFEKKNDRWDRLYIRYDLNDHKAIIMGAPRAGVRIPDYQFILNEIKKEVEDWIESVPRLRLKLFTGFEISIKVCTFAKLKWD